MSRIVLIKGGCSSERDVSLASGAAVAEALRRNGFDVVEIDITAEALPRGMDPERDVVFPVLHGGYGEGGGIQADLETAGFSFAGCDAASSRLCMDKAQTRVAVAAAGVPVADGVVLEPGVPVPDVDSLIAKLGDDVVAKPTGEGSSVGVTLLKGADAIREWLVAGQRSGVWLVERRIHGRELTCGILNGAGMGVVQIVPDSGVYDFTSKYTPGSTKYLFPAPISDEAAERVRKLAATAFRACGCRDYARADFIMPEGGEPVFLEMNTLPGMTSTSLLPKSASCIGLDFDALVGNMIEPARARALQKLTFPV